MHDSPVSFSCFDIPIIARGSCGSLHVWRHPSMMAPIGSCLHVSWHGSGSLGFALWHSQHLSSFAHVCLQESLHGSGSLGFALWHSQHLSSTGHLQAPSHFSPLSGFALWHSQHLSSFAHSCCVGASGAALSSTTASSPTGAEYVAERATEQRTRISKALDLILLEGCVVVVPH